MPSLRLVAAGSLILALGAHAALAQEASWVDTYGLQEDDRRGYGDRIEVASVAPSPGGGFLAVGTVKRFGNSPHRAWLGKLGPTGLLEWQRVASAAVGTRAYAVRATGAGYVVAGESMQAGPFGTGPQAWLFCVDLEGNPLWQRRFPEGSFARGTFTRSKSALIVRADGTYSVVGGYFKGPGSSGAWFVRVSADGSVIASKRYKLKGLDDAVGIAESPDGGHVVVGNAHASIGDFPRPFLLRLDPMGAPTAAQPAFHEQGVLHSVIRVTDGGYLVGGTYSRLAWVIRLQDDLTIGWERALRVTPTVRGYQEEAWGDEWVAVREGAGGGCTVATSGSQYPREGVFVYRLDAQGVPTQELVYQPPDLEPTLGDVQAGPDGRLLAVGWSPGAAGESAVSWALSIGAASARGDCEDVSWGVPPVEPAGVLPTGPQLPVEVSDVPITGSAEPLVLEDSTVVRGGRTCAGIEDPLTFDWGDAADAWTRCVVSPGSTGEPAGDISRCAPQGCFECAYSFVEGVLSGKLPSAVIDLYAGIRGPTGGTPPVPKDPAQLASLLGRLPAGKYLTSPVRDELARALAKGTAGAGPLARVVNAVELDQAIPRRKLLDAAVRGGRSATADFGSVAWLDFRRVEKPGRASLEITAGIPARAPDHLPLWPLATYRFRTDAGLAKGGYVDLAFSTAGLPMRRPASVRVLEWDGKAYRDVTRGVDAARGVVSARTDRLRDYVLMRFAPGACAPPKKGSDSAAGKEPARR